MRPLLLAAAATLIASPALAQTVGTVFPNNQDTSNRPAEQSMQQVGGENSGPGVNVQNRPVRPPPKISHTHIVTRKGAPAKQAAPPKR